MERCPLSESVPMDLRDMFGEVGALPTLFFLPVRLLLQLELLFGVGALEPGSSFSSSRGESAGLRLDTGTFEKCSVGILILEQHLAQTVLLHSLHWLPQVNNPKRVLRQRKQIFPFSTSPFRLQSTGSASSSALVRT